MEEYAWAFETCDDDDAFIDFDAEREAERDRV